MTRFTPSVSASFLAAFCFVASSAMAEESLREMAVRSLRGLSVVQVKVDDPGQLLGSDGITSSLLQSGVEGRLRRAGVFVSPNKDFSVNRGVLVLKVGAKESTECSGYRTSYLLMVFQAVNLQRDEQMKVSAVTWMASDGEILTPHQTKMPVLTKVDDLVDRFTRDYLSVNPASR